MLVLTTRVLEKAEDGAARLRSRLQVCSLRESRLRRACEYFAPEAAQSLANLSLLLDLPAISAKSVEQALLRKILISNL